jgi:hypothetical protein
MTSTLAALGRLRQHDQRNADFPLPKIAASRTSRYWSVGTVLDQGSTPQCVGYAGWGWLRGGPTVNKAMPFTPEDLYHWAQDRDEWPGADYDGTSTLGLMKALKDKGYITEYRWAFDAMTLVNWVLEKGPVLVGTDWFMDMFTPDRFGYLEPTGDNAGGHEWRIIGANLERKDPLGRWKPGAVRMVNSWGRGWGDYGKAWMAIEVLDGLITNGEAVTAEEIKL